MTDDHEHLWEQPEVVVSTYVLSGMEPVRMVIHHHVGDWSVLCGTVERADDLVGEPLSWLMTHPELGGLARTLPTGVMVTREDPSQAWMQEPAPPDDA